MRSACLVNGGMGVNVCTSSDQQEADRMVRLCEQDEETVGRGVKFQMIKGKISSREAQTNNMHKILNNKGVLPDIT